MAKKNTSTQRIPGNFTMDMEKVLDTRVKKGLLPIKEVNFPKAVDLLTRTDGYKRSLKELEIIPEKLKFKGKGFF